MTSIESRGRWARWLTGFLAVAATSTPHRGSAEMTPKTETSAFCDGGSPHGRDNRNSFPEAPMPMVISREIIEASNSLTRVLVSLSDGTSLEHVMWTCGPTDPPEAGAEFDVPWLVLQLPPYCAPTGVPGNCSPASVAGPGQPPAWQPGWPVYSNMNWFAMPPTTSPYSWNPANLPPNPNFPSTNPAHHNTTRHWTTSPTFNIRIRPSMASAPNISPFLGVAQQSALGMYRWSDFQQQIERAFANYDNVETAAIRIFVNTTYNDTTFYDLCDPVAPMGTFPSQIPPLNATFGAGVLVWDNRTGPPGFEGPTGNQSNDVILLQNRTISNPSPGGFCSMLVDPADGRILECDIIFDTSFFIGVGLGGQIRPEHTSAFMHEVGHALGLGHTNLHPGGDFRFGAPVSPVQTNTPNRFAPTMGPGFINSPVTPQHLPAMTGTICRFPPPAMLNPPLASLNVLELVYPSPFSPLGTVSNVHLDDAAALSYIYPATNQNLSAVPYSATTDPLINRTATIRGYVRGNGGGAPLTLLNVIALTRGFGSTLGSWGLPTRATLSGLARLVPNDVVGRSDTVANLPGSGGFEIIGVPISPLSRPVVDLLVEPPECLNVPTRYFSEWINERFLNPGAIDLLNNQGSTNELRTPTNMMDHPQFGLQSNEQTLPGGTPRSIGSMEIVAGTILEVVLQQGTNGVFGVDQVSRPLVSILPRVRPIAGSGASITITVKHEFPLAKPTLLVNGSPFPDLSLFQLPPVAPNETVWSIRENEILGTAGPVSLEFRVREQQLGGPQKSLLPVQGINRVEY